MQIFHLSMLEKCKPRGDAMVLGKLSVPGRPTVWITVGHRFYCACSRCGWGLFGHFYSILFSSLSPSLWKTARYRLQYCLKGKLSPKQPTINQPSTSQDQTSVLAGLAFSPSSDILERSSSPGHGYFLWKMVG